MLEHGHFQLGPKLELSVLCLVFILLRIIAFHLGVLLQALAPVHGLYLPFAEVSQGGEHVLAENQAAEMTHVEGLQLCGSLTFWKQIDLEEDVAYY